MISNIGRQSRQQHIRFPVTLRKAIALPKDRKKMKMK